MQVNVTDSVKPDKLICIYTFQIQRKDAKVQVKNMAQGLVYYVLWEAYILLIMGGEMPSLQEGILAPQRNKKSKYSETTFN